MAGGIGTVQKDRPAKPQGSWHAECTRSTRARQRTENAAGGLFEQAQDGHFLEACSGLC